MPLLNRLRMRQVALMLAIEARGTLSARYEDISITQTSAPKILHELEDALGHPLFDRVGRGLRVNVAGSCVTQYFRGMRGGIEAMRRELDALHRQDARRSGLDLGPVALQDLFVHLTAPADSGGDS